MTIIRAGLFLACSFLCLAPLARGDGFDANADEAFALGTLFDASLKKASEPLRCESPRAVAIDRQKNPRELIDEINRSLVANCAQKNWPKNRVVVSKPVGYRCAINPALKGVRENVIGKAQYTMEKTGGVIKLGLHMRFALYPIDGLNTEDTLDIMLQSVQACKPELEAFYRRAGFQLDLEIDTNREQRSSKYPANTVLLAFGQGRHNSSLYYYFGFDGDWQKCIVEKGLNLPKCLEFRQRSYCFMMGHEVGHLLGLPDEYPDHEKCPDREFPAPTVEQNPRSVMGKTVENWDDVAFYPRHLGKILEDACNDERSRQSLIAMNIAGLLEYPIPKDVPAKFCANGPYQSLLTPQAVALLPKDVFHDEGSFDALGCAQGEAKRLADELALEYWKSSVSGSKDSDLKGLRRMAKELALRRDTIGQKAKLIAKAAVSDPGLRSFYSKEQRAIFSEFLKQ